MADFAVDGKPIMTGTIVHPVRGAWTADLEVADGEALTGAVSLQMPGLTLSGTVESGGVHAERQRLRLVGGKGGLRKQVPGQHYRRTATARTVLDNILAAAGEELAPGSDAALLSTLLEHYQSPGGTAGAALDALCATLETSWTLTEQGEVLVKQPTWLDDAPDHVLIDHLTGEGVFLVAFADRAGVPGTTFQGQQVQAIEHRVEPGSWRSLMRYGENVDDVLRSLVQHFAGPRTTLQVYEGRVSTQGADGTVDIEVDEKLGLGPGFQGVTVALVGPFSVKVAPGARCIVEFLNGDLRRPIVTRYLEATFTEVTLRATSKIALAAPAVDVGNGGAAVTLAGGSQPVVRAGDNISGPSNGAGAVDGVVAVGGVPSTVKA